MLKRNKNIF